MTFLLCFLCFLSLCQLVYGNAYGVILARTDRESRRFCMIYSPVIGITPSKESEAIFYPLINLVPWDGCDNSSSSLEDIQDKIVLVNRYASSCTIQYLARTMHSLGAAGVIVVKQKKKGPEKKNATAFDNQNEKTKTMPLAINITLGMIVERTYNDLMAMNSNITMKMYGPQAEADRIDYSLIAIWTAAMFIVGIGCYWSGIIHYQHLQRLHLHHPVRRRTDTRARRSRVPRICSKTLTFSVLMITLLVFLMSGLMLLLYFFYSYLVLFIIGLFCIASTVAVFQILDAIFKFCVSTPLMLPKFKIRKFVIHIAVHQIFLAGVCASFTIFWVITRKEWYAWICQDILGLFFCINILRTLRLPNAMLCTLLLLLLFVYDIIFVFVTPYLTKSGESIMVHVATGGGGTEEQLPMLFKFPHMKYTEVSSVCEVQEFSLLGFGDILVPGLFLAFLHGFDMEINSKRVYFISGLVSYGAGLILTFIGMYMMRTAQPALLYLVPCTLIPVYIISMIRKELKALWLGNAQLVQRVQVPTEPRSIPVTPQTETIGDNPSPTSSEENQLIR